MALEENGFFSPGKWGFMEGWPRGAEAPVFDVCHGEQHVARIFKDAGEWRLVLRAGGEQLATDLASLLHVLDMVAKRMAAFEEQGDEQPVGSRQWPPAIAQQPEEKNDGSALVFAQMIGRALAATR